MRLPLSPLHEQTYSKSQFIGRTYINYEERESQEMNRSGSDIQKILSIFHPLEQVLYSELKWIFLELCPP